MNSHRSTDRTAHSAAAQALIQFVNVVSHDFSAPLRHARYFSSTLIASLGEQVSDEQRDLAINVEKSLEKMELMLASLLRYSRLISTFDPIENTDVCSVLELARNKYSQDPVCDAIRFTSANQPITATVDTKQLSTLLGELIDNAIKFQSPERELQIDVSLFVKDQALILTVSDNGIGLSPQDMEFTLPIFRQLDPSTRGDGVGLALVQRIVENHHGTLSFEHKPQGGLEAIARLPV